MAMVQVDSLGPKVGRHWHSFCIHFMNSHCFEQDDSTIKIAMVIIIIITNQLINKVYPVRKTEWLIASYFLRNSKPKNYNTIFRLSNNHRLWSVQTISMTCSRNCVHITTAQTIDQCLAVILLCKKYSAANHHFPTVQYSLTSKKCIRNFFTLQNKCIMLYVFSATRRASAFTNTWKADVE